MANAYRPAIVRFHINPPAQCDLCQEAIQDEFYEFTLPSTDWATGCPKCFGTNHGHVGQGYGRHYMRVPKTEDFMQIGG